ncbi:hypothetical protein DIE04_19105 [Burkholderia sp. Bp8994]|nr:hypothetical protein DIE04_19105 [Burkholderia sp. Bp8994]
MAIRRTLVLMLGVTTLVLVILAAAILMLAALMAICRMTISSSISSSRQHLPAAGRRTPNDSRRWKLK